MLKLCFFLLIPCLLSGQVTQKSATITASRSIGSPPPDQAVFDVGVSSGISTGLDTIVAALQGTGITALNLTAVYSSGSPARPRLQWTFFLPVPFASMSDTLSALVSLQKTFAQMKNGPLVLSYAVQGTQVSAQAQQAQQCLTSDLVADAQARAQQLADAAGLILGPVLAVSDGSGGTGATAGVYLAFLGVPSFGGQSFTAPSTCTVVVKFALFGG